MNGIFEGFLYFLWDSSVVWLPIGLLYMFWKLWIYYINQLFIRKMDWRLLYIKLPSEVRKSPLAMEMVLKTLWNPGGVATWYNRWWEGRVRTWYSLEIVSIEGNIYFFIRTEARFADQVKASIYSQYPQSEVTEVDDYTRHVDYIGRRQDWEIFGTEFKLKKPDVYPIKTYVDWGMDRAVGVDEEEKVDPITEMMEYMSTLGPGEQIWWQCLVTADTNRYDKPGTWFLKRGWREEGEAELKKLKDDYSVEVADGKKDFNPARLTSAQKEVIDGIERSLGKSAFDSGVRLIYLANKDAFRADRIAPCLGMMGHYNNVSSNLFTLSNVTGYAYPWQDIAKMGVEAKKRELFRAYVNRGWFYPPYKRKPYILTVEEVATIFHFPGRVVETPTFDRVDATKSEPPTNLPV